MLRTVGLCVIVISGVGCGFAMSNELGRRKKMMEMILRMIILLRGEIRYGNKSLYDAFTGASGKLEGKYREFFILTAQKMKEKTGDSFGTIFRESAGKCLDLDCLSQEERDRFYSLGDQLGYLGLDMQLKQMDLFLYCVDYCFAISGSRSRKGETVEVSLIFKIAAVGILVSVLCQILKHSGRDEQAFLVSLAGLLMVLFWIVPYIYELFESIQQLFVL